MSNRLRLLYLVSKASIKAELSRQDFAGDTNPQVVEMRIRAEVARDVFDAVQQALKGDFMMLKVWAGGEE